VKSKDIDRIKNYKVKCHGNIPSPAAKYN
jgi:hypothetical protein